MHLHRSSSCFGKQIYKFECIFEANRMDMKLQHNPRSTITVWIIHVLCWLFFFTLPLLFRPEPNPNHNNNLPEWLGIPFPMFFNNLFLLLAFYANLLWAMPHFFKKDRWFLYAAITLVFLLFSYWIHPLTRALESIFFDTVGLVDMGLGDRKSVV